MTPKEKRNALLAEKLVGNLKQRHYEAFFCHTAQEAVEKITGMIPEGSSVTWGGSMTIRDMGLTRALHNKERLDIWDRDLAPDREAAQEIYRRTFYADYYLSSVNAMSEDGEIVNIDGNGNRVAAITFGPRDSRGGHQQGGAEPGGCHIARPQSGGTCKHDALRRPQHAMQTRRHVSRLQIA